MVYEWDGSPGEKTPADALRSSLAWYEGKARGLATGVAAPAGGPIEQDPVRLKVLIRGLRALLTELPAAEPTSGSRHTLSVTASGGSGVDIAHVEIAEQGEGGYRIDRISVTGLVTDDPSCRTS
jgi:hypothetical protein